MYMHNVYAIEPNSSVLIFELSSGIFPEAFKQHVVTNVGRTQVEAKTIYGTVFGWIGTVDQATVNPGEQKTINNHGRSYYRLGLKIFNYTSTRAIVCAAYTDDSYPGGNDGDINIDYNNVVKKLVVFGVKFVPYVGPTVSGLLAAFWPENKENVWEQIRDKVQDLIDEAMLKTINSILTGEILYYQERIKVLESQLNPNNIELRDNVPSYYMNLAQSLIGLELKFTFPENDFIAFSMLPLYAAVVMMKMNYYAIGIAKAQELGITDDDVKDLKSYSTRLIEDQNGVSAYINAMYKNRLDDIYDTNDVRDIYNSMMNTRSYIAVNGLEYIPVWRSILENPLSAGDAYVDAVSYSEFHGRTTPNLCKEATPELLQAPLTPKLINGKRDKLTAVELHIWRIDSGAGSPKIGGVKVYFDSGDNYIMGNSSSETIYVDFKGAFLSKLRVAGGNALDTFTFYFSDGREETYGTYSGTETVFELKNHHVASMFLSSDSKSLAGQAANFAVSYVQDY